MTTLTHLLDNLTGYPRNLAQIVADAHTLPVADDAAVVQ